MDGESTAYRYIRGRREDLESESAWVDGWKWLGWA